MPTETCPTERAHAVKRFAATLGFDACGIGAAGPIDVEDYLGAWLSQGYHADMHYMVVSKDIRQDPRRKLPGARSVIVVARNYYGPRPVGEPGTGRVSRYAWGVDYHRVLRKPLRALAGFIRGLQPDAQCCVSIDTGPVMEKAWAARAGIGWIGKNSLVLREGLGSWFFLAVILTTVELAADEPVQNRCGDCTLCMDACPTAAIVAPCVVDARRCISYLTIENRRNVPEELRDSLGDWVFGCDVCQEVCPWNRSPVTTSERAFHPRSGLAHLNPEALAEMDEATFATVFQNSPILRVQLSGMRRNAAGIGRNPVSRSLGCS